MSAGKTGGTGMGFSLSEKQSKKPLIVKSCVQNFSMRLNLTSLYKYNREINTIINHIMKIHFESSLSNLDTVKHAYSEHTLSLIMI